MFNRVLLIFLLSLIFTVINENSVSNASSSDGATFRDIAECSIKSCFINLLIIHKSEILKQQKNSDGTFYEIYKIHKNSELSLEEYVHALVSTGRKGLWVISSKPIQGFESTDLFIVIKTSYDKHEKATKVEVQVSKSS